MQTQSRSQTHSIELQEKTTSIYIFTDGYQDQFGGPKEKKFQGWPKCGNYFYL
jgi:hypothetical protein